MDFCKLRICYNTPSARGLAPIASLSGCRMQKREFAIAFFFFYQTELLSAQLANCSPRAGEPPAHCAFGRIEGLGSPGRYPGLGERLGLRPESRKSISEESLI